MVSVGLIVSILVGAGVFWLERQRHYQTVITDPLQTLKLFNARLHSSLDNRDLSGQGSKILKEMQKDNSFCMDRESGSYIFVRVVDNKGKLLTSITRSDEPDQPDYGSMLKKPQVTNQTKFRKGYKSDVIRLDSSTLIIMAAPLNNSAGEQVAIIEGVYEVTSETVDKIIESVVHFSIIAILIVLMTTALLYPTIIGLMKHLSRLAGNLLYANLGIIKVLGGAISKRDSDTNEHNYRVTIFKTVSYAI